MDELITIIPPNSTITPSYLAFELDIELDSIKGILVKLSNRKLITPFFVIDCTGNEETQETHSISFNSQEKLASFVNNKKYQCLRCDGTYNFENTKVFFKTLPLNKEDIV